MIACYDAVSVADLVVEVRPAYRCSRWSWHLVDKADRSVFETEFDYGSPSEARQAGYSRLAELIASAWDTRAAAGTSSGDPRIIDLSVRFPISRAA